MLSRSQGKAFRRKPFFFAPDEVKTFEDNQASEAIRESFPVFLFGSKKDRFRRTNSSLKNLEDFMRKHGGYRDSLALRKLTGEHLSSIEEANLAVLNLKLAKLLADKESTFMQEVKANRAEVRRLLAKHGLKHG